MTKTPDFDPVLPLLESDGKIGRRDVRTVPFLRFEANESHGEGLFSFRFGDEAQGTVHGDREHPFVVRNLLAWNAHYAIRPNMKFFLLDGLRVVDSAYGIYHPDYDMHVYRDVAFHRVTAEPLNGGHDETSLPYGDFSFERLTFNDCHLSRDPLVQLTCIGPKSGLASHFRGVTITNSRSDSGIVNFGGGPRTNKTEHPVSYYFHDLPTAGIVTQVTSTRIAPFGKDDDYRHADAWMGREARAFAVEDVKFPEFLVPIDDLPPATLITSIAHDGATRILRSVSHDNDEIATVTVNGRPAKIISQQAGVADWTITLEVSPNYRFLAQSVDRSGNTEPVPHQRGE